ncbi:MAG TPA: pyroglutamyl-peptidase I [Stellaceae bacterium]|jgi:pyroglutamyl-peptidase|nr:pyroglutamyl-peptidase I [Stellaceae bacterium]
MKALVTGFEPFGGDSINPSFEALVRLPRSFDELVIETRVLPCRFGAAITALEEAIAATRPEFVLGVGLAGGRSELSLERVAINVDDARIADNGGAQPVDRPIMRDGPAAYFATLPIKAAVAAMREAGLPAAVSNSAGTFVCNHLFYGLMHLAATRFRSMRAGFLHVPYLPSQAARLPGTPSMALDQIVRGIEIILSVTATRSDDIAEAGFGAIA